MIGIQSHTHEERARIVQQLLPLLQQRLGDNLLAVAAQGSFARGEDGPYSDLELVAFVKKMPNDDSRGIGKIYEGMLIEVVWSTEELYFQEVKQLSPDWYLAGSDVLLPILNEDFIDRITRTKVSISKNNFLAEAKKHWHEVQESTAKVLNALKRENSLQLPLVLFDMYRHVLISLALINGKPYTTYVRMIEEAIGLHWKPESFDALTEVIIAGAYQDLPLVEILVQEVFTQLENYFLLNDVALYDDNFDPNVPAKQLE